jgi:hypothetical protein
MADKTTIVNRALSLIGAEPINNLTDDTPEASIANRIYEESRRSILSECLWNFATKREALNQVVETLPWTLDGVQNVFQLPADRIRIFGVSSRGATWRIEQDRLITDVTDIGIIYVFNLEDTTKFSSSFTDAFADKLAADMCYSTLNSGTNAMKMLEKYEGVSLPKAMAENSQEGTAAQVRDDLWSYAKYGFTPVGRNGIFIGN